MNSINIAYFIVNNMLDFGITIIYYILNQLSIVLNA